MVTLRFHLFSKSPAVFLLQYPYSHPSSLSPHFIRWLLELQPSTPHPRQEEEEGVKDKRVHHLIDKVFPLKNFPKNPTQ